MATAVNGGSVRRIALVVHPYRPAAQELADEARAWWETRGHEVVEVKGLSGSDPGISVEELDLVVSLGGDGTMLRSSQFASRHGVAVLGVNLGALGYLTQIEPSGLAHAFERLSTGDYEVDERMTLDVTLERAGEVQSFVALNDAVVEKTSQGHTMRLQLAINGENFLSYAADGFLVSTPSGSTAYNLSLRGPILSPSMRALVLTPISAHMLFDRTLILDEREWLSIEITGERAGIFVVDGLSPVAVEPGDVVTVRAGTRPARIVNLGGANFYRVLRSKFGLADR